MLGKDQGRRPSATQHTLPTAQGYQWENEAAFCGLFHVLRTVGANAFELELPMTMKVHPVFNVSLLRLYHGVYSPPGPIITEGEVEYEVERIIRHRGKG